jgi:hypothetical protein
MTAGGASGGTAGGVAQFRNEWFRLTTTGAVPARGGAALGETADGGLVLFGGFGPTSFLTDVWRLNVNATGSAWQQVLTTNVGPAVSGAAVAFDPARRQLVVVGGATTGTPASSETWVLDLETVTWSGPVMGPGPRYLSSLAFDSNRNVMLLFGGRSCGASCGTFIETNDLWEFNGSSWRELTTAGVRPSIREGASMVIRGDTLFVFGGVNALVAPSTGQTDSWALQGLGGTPTWQALTTPPFAPGRSQALLVFDPIRNVSVLFGGVTNATAQVTSFDASTWTFDHTTLTWSSGLSGQVPLRSPSARSSPSGAWSRTLNSVVLFGGLTGVSGSTNVVSDEVWLYGRTP